MKKFTVFSLIFLVLLSAIITANPNSYINTETKIYYKNQWLSGNQNYGDINVKDDLGIVKKILVLTLMRDDKKLQLKTITEGTTSGGAGRDIYVTCPTKIGAFYILIYASKIYVYVLKCDEQGRFSLHQSEEVDGSDKWIYSLNFNSSIFSYVILYYDNSSTLSPSLQECISLLNEFVRGAFYIKIINDAPPCNIVMNFKNTQIENRNMSDGDYYYVIFAREFDHQSWSWSNYSSVELIFSGITGDKQFNLTKYGEYTIRTSDYNISAVWFYNESMYEEKQENETTTERSLVHIEAVNQRYQRVVCDWIAVLYNNSAIFNASSCSAVEIFLDKNKEYEVRAKYKEEIKSQRFKTYNYYHKVRIVFTETIEKYRLKICVYGDDAKIRILRDSDGALVKMLTVSKGSCTDVLLERGAYMIYANPSGKSGLCPCYSIQKHIYLDSDKQITINFTKTSSSITVDGHTYDSEQEYYSSYYNNQSQQYPEIKAWYGVKVLVLNNNEQPVQNLQIELQYLAWGWGYSGIEGWNTKAVGVTNSEGIAIITFNSTNPSLDESRHWRLFCTYQDHAYSQTIVLERNKIVYTVFRLTNATLSDSPNLSYHLWATGKPGQQFAEIMNLMPLLLIVMIFGIIASFLPSGRRRRR